MKSMLRTFEAVYYDVYSQSRAKPNDKDLSYVKRRSKHEGKSFFTITLPLLESATMAGLESGHFDPNCCSSFRGTNGNRALPLFLVGLLSNVFDIRSGKLRDDACPTSLWGIRQLTLLFKKVELDCSDERIKASIVKFVSTDAEVRPLRSTSLHDRENLRTVTGVLFGSCFSRVNTEIMEGELMPRHGSGAVAEKFSNNGKYDCRFYDRLEPLLPRSHYYSPSLGCGSVPDSRDTVEIGSEEPCRLATVPKTLKAPRLIAIEPAIMQWAQQGLMRSVYANLRHCRGGKILNIKDQTINGRRALKGSKDRSFCTIDLSEASDRVPAGLVSYLTKPWGHFNELLFRSRSSRCEAFGEVIRLKKFASMGSAMCFPMEAIVFAVICIYAMLVADNMSITKNNILRYSSKLTVFGDDIVSENRYALSIKLALEHFGMKVNQQKSFSEGWFRESCGVDAFKGDDITPAYCRREIPTSLSSAEKVVSTIDFVNQLWSKGLWKASESVAKQLEESLRIKFPIAQPTSPLLSYSSEWSMHPISGRYNRQLHRFELKGFTISGKTRKAPMSDVGTLSKALNLLSEKNQPDNQVMDDYLTTRRKALIEAISRCVQIDEEPSPHALRLKRGWASVA